MIMESSAEFSEFGEGDHLRIHYTSLLNYDLRIVLITLGERLLHVEIIERRSSSRTSSDL